MPGIDISLTSVIAGEIGDPNAFDGPRKLMGCAGMDPTKSESGETVRSGGHMLKRGPGALRWTLM
ncbi:transposase [Gordonibacter pamelaeae]|uniref:transposase n=1 Tax=Gordonibacter pamelaeae TaxID=471189 RepID=UPI0022B2325A|nr:transposase [Gordonibacter pamelaeae]